MAIAPAMAATHGYGYNEGNGFIGQEMINGVATFCLQITAAPPTGQSGFVGNQVWETMSVDDNARVSFAATEFGQIPDNNWATATHLFTWSLADTAEYNSHGMSGDDYFIARAPSSQHGDIRNKLAQIRAQAANISAGGVGSGSVDLTFQIDSENNYLGTLTVSNMSPADGVGTITLTDAVFSSNGSVAIAGVTNGMVLDVMGTPGDDIADYKAGATGIFDAPGGYAGMIGLYHTENGAQQYTAGPGPKGVTHFEASTMDPVSRSTVFQPVVGTRVASVYVQAGEKFADIWTFSTAPDANGRNNPWRQRIGGAYLEVTGKGVVYGPFNQQPEEADAPPAHAPIAGRMEATTTAAEGPTVDYTVESDTVARESGFYTVVTTIDASEHSVAAQRQMPDGYTFADRFGQVVETMLVPSNIHFTTDMVDNELVIGGSTNDVISPTVHGGAWVMEDGVRVPAELTGYVRYSESAPVVSDEAPEGAVLIETITTTLTDLESHTSGAIGAGYKAGFVNVQWCITPDQDMINPWCDQYGVPSETFEVLAPTITTMAKPNGIPGGTVTDTAVVSGPIPSSGIEVTFEGFLQPENAEAASCAPEDLIYTSSEAITVTEAGEYTSEHFEVTDEHLGTVYWVETARIPGTEIVIHKGKCGEPSETTVIKYPTVTTKATPEVELGQPAHDIGIVDGETLDGSYLVYAAYKQSGSTAVCTAATEVFNTKGSPVLVAGSGEYASADVVFNEAGTYFWIEQLFGPDDKIIHTGECGAEGETTIVKPKPVVPPMGLASTGFDGALLIFGIGFLLAGGIALTVIQIRRRRTEGMVTAKQRMP